MRWATAAGLVLATRSGVAQAQATGPAPAPAAAAPAAAPPAATPPPAPPAAAAAPPPPAPPPPPPAPPPSKEGAGPAAPATPVGPAVVVAPSPPAPPAVVPPPPPAFTIQSSIGTRVGLRLQDPDKPKDMTEIHLDNAYDATVEARFHGKATDLFSWVANFNAVLDQQEYASTNAGAASVGLKGALGIMDLIAQYQPIKEFNIWAGRLLVPSDRSNFSGPFFISPWNYPGFYVPGAPPLGPKDGPTGRDQGVTVWGNAIGDTLKYYFGVYGIDLDAQPYFSGRVSYTLQGSEPGYFGSSTYYGAKSVATIGLGAQYQKNGSFDTTTGTPTKNTGLVMVDGLAEEVTGAGTFSVEGQYYHFNAGYSFAGGFIAGATAPLVDTGIVAAPENAFYLLFAYLTPENIGIGKLQPLVRLQQTFSPDWTVFDAALAYVIKDYSARVVATYQHIGRGTSGGPDPTQNAIQLGIQLQTL
ncbi:MAG TPA: hypothetical protein VEK07_05900 [Polyangiaceae bacterium]|nr:hypothetical protein [Polyangiaceae bacterium]